MTRQEFSTFLNTLVASKYSTKAKENTLYMLIPLPKAKRWEVVEKFQILLQKELPEKEFWHETSRIFGKAMGYE